MRVALTWANSAQIMATVLLLDDNETNLSSLQLALEHLGHRVLTAENGAKGLQLLASRCPHVVVTDYQMPIIDGVEFCRQLRNRIIFRRIPVILLSGKPEPEHPNPSWTHYFRKPVSLALLINTIEKLVEPRLYREFADLGAGPFGSRWAAITAACWP